jgi:hypothetical protein
MLNVSESDVIRAQQPKISDLHDKVLYDMVRKFPKHVEDGEIFAKVLIIGRAYGVDLKRGANHDNREGQFYSDKIIPAIKESNIDELIKNVGKLKKITTENLELIIKTHKDVTNILEKMTGMNNRSFASKYLHFHCEKAFFIYDSIAKKKILQLSKEIVFEYTITDDMSINSDKDYEHFCLKCLALRDNIEEKYGVVLSPRQLDNLLLEKV